MTSNNNLSRLLSYSLLASVVALTGCLSQPRDERVSAQLPAAFSSEEELPAPPPTGWLQSFADPALNRWVDQAVQDNFDINAALARLEAARQQRIIAGSTLWPSLGLELDGQRSKTVTSSTTSYDNNFAANAVISWEVDLWGRLRDGRKAADYLYQAQQADLDYLRLSLAGQVAQAWYNVEAATQLQELLRQRVDNLKTNLDIIEYGYRQGINAALDVYLARTDLSAEMNNLYQQQATTRDAIRQLQLLLGQYPSGELPEAGSDASLPALPPLDLSQLNTETVRYRYDLQSAYLELLATDRDLAAAHKARFPSFSLTGRAGDSSDELDTLLDTSSLAWNLLANLSQPLFAGGRLKAAEEQQRQLVLEKEQQYLQALHAAFSEVAQALTNETSLNQRLEQVEEAKKFAEAAETIAFDEYRKGLSEYTAVLEAQRRAFAAQNTVVTIRNQLLQNRIQLLLALGGHYQ